MGYDEQLLMFLKQADDSSSQATKHYLETYNGLRVRVSFGQGHLARVPWIAFLKEPHTVRNGIYPVYLYFKSVALLVLAFGVSENATKDGWKIDRPITLREHFEKNNLGEISKYGNSYFFKSYRVDNVKSMKTPGLAEDLNEIIAIYNAQE